MMVNIRPRSSSQLNLSLILDAKMSSVSIESKLKGENHKQVSSSRLSLKPTALSRLDCPIGSLTCRAMLRGV